MKEKSKRKIPLIGKLAVKFEFITKEQLKRAVLICDESAKDGKTVSLPEVLIRTEMIQPEEIKKLHKIKTDYESKQNKKTSGSTEYDILISKDKLKVELVVPENFTGIITCDTILSRLHKDGIKFGVVKDYEIENYIKNIKEHGKPKLIARGTPVFEGNPSKIECFFNADYFRNELMILDSNQTKTNETMIEVEEGDLLIEKSAMIPPDSGVDVFGETIDVEPFSDIVIRAGVGTELFEKEMKIVAKSQGVPILSVDGRVNVYPTVEINGDYGVTSGPLEMDSNLVVSGIVTGEYKVKGGSISALEIRDADIDISGDINVEIGITGSVIKCEGDIRAKYIRGSVIETYGSVITEQEIMDSKIISSGICISANSKFVASTISAKRGVKALGIGTETSVPCEITIGKDVNVEKKMQGLNNTISKNIELITELNDKTLGFTEEQNNVNQKLKSLIDHHQQLDNAISATDSNIAVLELKEAPDQLQKAKQTLIALKKKHKITLLSIREFSEMLKEIGSELIKIPEEVIQIEKENRELELDKAFILGWAEKNDVISILEVAGDIASGTIVAGKFSFEEMKKINNVSITELPVKGPELEEWAIDIKKIK